MYFALCVPWFELRAMVTDGASRVDTSSARTRVRGFRQVEIKRQSETLFGVR
jgi:hypothetical protein